MLVKVKPTVSRKLILVGGTFMAAYRILILKCLGSQAIWFIFVDSVDRIARQYLYNIAQPSGITSFCAISTQIRIPPSRLIGVSLVHFPRSISCSESLEG